MFCMQVDFMRAEAAMAPPHHRRADSFSRYIEALARTAPPTKASGSMKNPHA
jgi:hypothetical protein